MGQPTTRWSSAAASQAARPRSSSAAPARAWRSSRKTRPAGVQARCARTSSRPRACRRSNGSGCSSRWKRPARLRPRVHAWTRWGWIRRRPSAPPAESTCAARCSTRWCARSPPRPGRRDAARRSAERLPRDDGTFAGVVVRNREGEERELRARLAIGADGRDSKHRRALRSAGQDLPPQPLRLRRLFRRTAAEALARRIGLDHGPAMGGGLPDRHDLTFYAAMPTKDRLPEFKQRPRGRRWSSSSPTFPGAPPIREARASSTRCRQDRHDEPDAQARRRRAWRWSATRRSPTDPLFGVGCGWAFQSAEWLAESVAPALRGGESLEQGLSATGAATRASCAATPA